MIILVETTGSGDVDIIAQDGVKVDIVGSYETLDEAVSDLMAMQMVIAMSKPRYPRLAITHEEPTN